MRKNLRNVAADYLATLLAVVCQLKCSHFESTHTSETNNGSNTFFYNVRLFGVFFSKFGLDGNLTKCKYVDGTSEGHARSLWEKNVIKQSQEDNIFLILLTYYIMC